MLLLGTRARKTRRAQGSYLTAAPPLSVDREARASSFNDTAWIPEQNLLLRSILIRSRLSFVLLQVRRPLGHREAPHGRGHQRSSRPPGRKYAKLGPDGHRYNISQDAIIQNPTDPPSAPFLSHLGRLRSRAGGRPRSSPSGAPDPRPARPRQRPVRPHRIAPAANITYRSTYLDQGRRDDLVRAPCSPVGLGRVLLLLLGHLGRAVEGLSREQAQVLGRQVDRGRRG